MIFNFNEGTIEVGEEWTDKSLILLSHPSDLSISITRDMLPLGLAFHEFVNRELDKLSRQLKGYKEEHRNILEIGGYESVLSEFSWNSPQGSMHQLSAIINLANHPVIITISSLEVITEGQREQLMKIIHSFKARTEKKVSL